jgi:hypothetical protein
MTKKGKIGMGVFVAIVALVFICAATMSTVLAEGGQAVTRPSQQTGQQVLKGRWIRPDGGYILELGEIGKDGTVKAAYFNPKPINVSHALVKSKDRKLSLLVELRDVNYPGSRYDLSYDSRTDQLKGTYFQAVEGRTFDVEFVRIR